MQHLNNLTELTVAIKEWQSKQFPESTPWSVFAHLKKELNNELFNALVTYTHDPDDLQGHANMAEEIADVFHLLVALAQHCQVDVTSAVREKFLINIDREWADPDEHGVVEHKR